ncbi:hypothetical protein B296_00033261 [Ensete ventricosum]|uniref:Secreted protein n=1 Tax=Ensete ventricosum TaxID=4639 RepID=A0A426YSZ3_ENSVE|nr:hypothetical protein B296_00033261 [Ensete ventricosum]
MSWWWPHLLLFLLWRQCRCRAMLEDAERHDVNVDASLPPVPLAPTQMPHHFASSSSLSLMFGSTSARLTYVSAILNFFNIVTVCFSKTTTEAGGHLTIEDIYGSLKTIFVRDGMLDFLKKVLFFF